MKYFFAGLGWLLGLAALGAAVLLNFSFFLFHHLTPAQWQAAAKLGAEIGVNIFLLAFCFAALPGTHRTAAAAREKFGVIQGLWGMAGFAISMGAGALVVINALSIAALIHVAHHQPFNVDFQGHDVLAAAAIAGEFSTGLWVLWYFHWLGPARRTDGSPTGLAWRPATPAAYATAAAAAIAIIAVVMLMYHLDPPNLTKLQNLPMAKLFSGGGILMLPLLAIAVFIGPALEEMTFRGIGFAGLATKLGPVWAGIVTTLLFMAAHAPEKLYYPPGFLDVGLAATASVLLRLKYRSIRPCILLHIVYNAGAMLAASMT